MSGESKRLKTVRVEPEIEAVTDKSTGSNKVVGMAPSSFSDRYRNLEVPTLPQKEKKQTQEIRNMLNHSEDGTI